MRHRLHVRIAVACCLLALLALLAGCSRPITAEQIAAEANRRHTFPLDLGDGLRLDAITADGQAIVSTVTLTDPTLATSPGLVDAMRTAARSDICREIAPLNREYVKAGLSVATVYRDAAGAQIVRVDVQPAEC